MTNSRNPFELTPEEEEVLDAIDEEEETGILKMDPAKAIEMLEKRIRYYQQETEIAISTCENKALKPREADAILLEIGRMRVEVEICRRRISEYKLMIEGKN